MAPDETRDARVAYASDRQTESPDHRIPRQTGFVDPSSSVWNPRTCCRKNESLWQRLWTDRSWVYFFAKKPSTSSFRTHRVGRANRALRRRDRTGDCGVCCCSELARARNEASLDSRRDSEHGSPKFLHPAKPGIPAISRFKNLVWPAGTRSRVRRRIGPGPGWGERSASPAAREKAN